MKYHIYILVVLFILFSQCNPSSNNVSIDSVFYVDSATNDTKKSTDSFYEENDTIVIVLLKEIIKEKYSTYKYLGHRVGDIDNDNIADIILVVERLCNENDAEYMSDLGDSNKCRNVIFLKNIGESNYSVIGENNCLVGCSACGGGGVGDPTLGSGGSFNFYNGTITYSEMYGACCKTECESKYKYDGIKKKWSLFEIEERSHCCNEFDKEGNPILRTTKKTQQDFGDTLFLF